MNTISTLAMRDAFAVAIRGIEPTAEALRDIRWSYTPSERRGGRAALEPATRNFDLIFSAAQQTDRWRGGYGTAYKVTLAVAASYSGVEPELRDHLKTEDRVDIHRALRRLINTPELDGLCEVDMIGEARERETETAHYVEHVFAVHYHQATR